MTDHITPEAHVKAMRVIREFEGCRLEAYADVTGLPTIGWGTIRLTDGRPVTLGMRLSQADADHCLSHDMVKFEQGIERHVTPQLSPNQNAALISFCYNLGLGAFYHSTMLRHINEGDLPGAAAEFPKWCHAGGKVVAGLVRRRKMERDLFELPE